MLDESRIKDSGITNQARWTIGKLSVAYNFLNVAKNYKRAYEFVKVIIWKTVSFFTSDTVKTAFLDDIIIA